MQTIYRVRCIYEVSYDLMFMGQCDRRTIKMQGYEDDNGIPIINKILNSHKYDQYSVMNISVRKVS
jgi:hypothetical protein